MPGVQGVNGAVAGIWSIIALAIALAVAGYIAGALAVRAGCSTVSSRGPPRCWPC